MVMNRIGGSECPDWYIASLCERYQFLVNLMADMKSKSVFRIAVLVDVSVPAILAYLSGNIWAALLVSVLIVFAFYHFQQQKRFLISSQMRSIEAEWSGVKDNVV